MDQSSVVLVVQFITKVLSTEAMKNWSLKIKDSTEWEKYLTQCLNKAFSCFFFYPNFTMCDGRG